MISVRLNVLILVLVPYAGSSYYSFQGNPSTEKVEIKYYYEVLCPYSVKFQSKILVPVIKEFQNLLILKPVPFGFAKFTETRGQLRLQCHHGSRECTGNRLDACAMYLLGNMSQAVLYNACMMDEVGDGLYYNAAEKCGRLMSIDPEPIKKCARGSLGDYLTKYYGEQSKKARIAHVPYVMLNGQVMHDYKLLRQRICQILQKPPSSCYFNS